MVSTLNNLIAVCHQPIDHLLCRTRYWLATAGQNTDRALYRSARTWAEDSPQGPHLIATKGGYQGYSNTGGDQQPGSCELECLKNLRWLFASCEYCLIDPATGTGTAIKADQIAV